MKNIVQSPRFYVVSSIVLVSLSLVSAIILTDIKIEPGQVATIVTTIMGFALLMITQYTAASKVASKTEEVKYALEESNSRTEKQLKTIEETGHAVHTLVNNEYELALRALAISQRHIATLTGRTSDIRAAEAAEKALMEHESKQIIVDSKRDDSKQ